MFSINLMQKKWSNRRQIFFFHKQPKIENKHLDGYFFQTSQAGSFGEFLVPKPTKWEHWSKFFAMFSLPTFQWRETIRACSIYDTFET